MKTLEYPFDRVPEPGATLDVAPGVKWLRMPLPFALDHINLWLIEDGAGWTIVDTGLRGATTRALWQQIFAEHLDGKPVKRIIVTHMHPDHIGQAGWLVQHCQASLWITRTEYLYGQLLRLDVRTTPPEEAVAFYHRAGFDEEALVTYRATGYGRYAKGVEPLPASYRRIVDGETIRIGEHDWRVIVGRGHAAEHACLLSDSLGLLISGDQILPRITSNVAVFHTEPEANPLGEWLDSHRRFLALPDEVLVLPSHNEPFYGLHVRLHALIAHHEARLATMAEFCATPRRAVDALKHLFHRPLDEFSFMLALGETIAHLNYLVAEGRITRRIDESGVAFYQKN